MKIFKVTQTFSPDHKNIIDIAKPSVGIKRGIFQSIRFESYKHMPQCKFSLYLKKAGLASRNIVHFFKKSHSTLYRSLLSLSSFIRGRIH